MNELKAPPAGRMQRWLRGKDPSFFFYLAARVLAGVLGIFTLRAVVGYLAREEYADWGYLSTLSSMLVPIVSLSLPQAMMRYYFDHKDSELDVHRSLVSTVFKINAAAIALLALGVGLLHAFGLYPVHEALYFAGVTSAAVLIAFFNYLTRTRNDYGLFFFNRMFEAVAFLGLVLWATAQGTGGSTSGRLLWLGGCLAATSWLSVLVNVAYYGRQGLLRPSAPLLPRAELASMLRFSWPVCLTFFVGWALSSSDIYLLRKLSTRTETADYVFAVGIVGVVSIVSQSALLDWPRFFYQLMRDGGDGRDQMIGSRARRFLWLHVATILGTRLLAGYAYELLGANAYSRGLDFLGLLLLGNFLFLAGNLFGSGIGYAKETKLGLFAFAVPGAVNFTLNLVLIPRYGALAAACTTVLAYALFAALMLYFGQRYYRFRDGARFALVAAAAAAVALIPLPFTR